MWVLKSNPAPRSHCVLRAKVAALCETLSLPCGYRGWFTGGQEPPAAQHCLALQGPGQTQGHLKCLTFSLFSSEGQLTTRNPKGLYTLPPRWKEME